MLLSQRGSPEMHIGKKQDKGKKVKIFKNGDPNRDIFSKEKIGIYKTQISQPGKKQHHHFIIEA